MTDSFKPELSTASDSPDDDTRTRHVFTLVHGTWAKPSHGSRLNGIFRKPGPHWYEQGSLLRVELERKFQGAVFHTAEWSGGNSLDARLAAAEKLAKEIQDLQAQYNKSHYYIIAHSHGGNVA